MVDKFLPIAYQYGDLQMNCISVTLWEQIKKEPF